MRMLESDCSNHAMTDFTTLTQQAATLKSAGRLDEAIEVYRRALSVAPPTGVAEHNLAAALGDAGDHLAAEQYCREAFARGLDAPETWLVRARSLVELRRFEAAEKAFRRALRRRPEMVEAHYEFAQLVWMRTGSRSAALRAIQEDLHRSPQSAGLQLVRARILQYSGDLAGAGDALDRLAAQWPSELQLLLPAAHVATLAGRSQRALAHARQAVSLAPADGDALAALAYALLAAGEAREAAQVAERLRGLKPLDQQAIALCATAWRMTGDTRHRDLNDYADLVRGYPIEPPAAWPDLDSYLGELGTALLKTHPYRSHPFGQSVRHGSQVANITRQSPPAIRAFPEAVGPVIDRHLAYLGTGQDPLRSRNTGRWRIQGMWSVRLGAGGFHASHVHPEGWLSSACHIVLPADCREDDAGRAGWLQFGEPGMPTQPRLEAEHFVQPQPGHLVLFPSYMWHGTVAFQDKAPRITIAFDIVPSLEAGANP